MYYWHPACSLPACQQCCAEQVFFLQSLSLSVSVCLSAKNSKKLYSTEIDAHLSHYTMFQKKTGPFVIASYLYYNSYLLHENFQKHKLAEGDVACCEYGINICDSLTILC